MKTNYLLPNKYKTLGWILLTIGLIGGIFIVITDYESDILRVQVLAIIIENNFLKPEEGYSYFKVLTNDIIDELSSVFIIIGGLAVGFTKEKIEDMTNQSTKLFKDNTIKKIIDNKNLPTTK